MVPTPSDLAPWNDLQADIAGFFEAHARGLVSVEYALTNGRGERFGRLRAAPGAATLEAVGLSARIGGDAKRGYRMLSDGAAFLTAAPSGRDPATLAIRCADRLYETRQSLLRNTAAATADDGAEIARITGGFAGRNYKATFDTATAGAFPIAVLLLHHLTTLRRRAYTT